MEVKRHDIVPVGGGGAGLRAAIAVAERRIAQLRRELNLTMELGCEVFREDDSMRATLDTVTSLDRVNPYQRRT